MVSESRKSSPSAAQEVCIDLPGESVRCWRSRDNLRVTLRKHRDVIFDLHFGSGKTYTVQSERSDFYDADSKKIVDAKRNEVVTFQDGVKLHLWVARDFKGALLLKCNNQLLMKIEPNKFDLHDYGDDPKTKPAPIIVALGAAQQLSAGAQDKTAIRNGHTPPLGRPSAAPVDEQCTVVCVVEGTPATAPPGIMEMLKKGGGKSGLADIDPYEIATRNWILGQLASGAAYVGDNWEWLRASIDRKTREGFKLVKARVHLVRGKIRFYFSGYSKFNAVFGPGGFGSSHERVLDIFAGAGKTSSTFAAATKGILGSLKNYALVAFIFSSVAAIQEWRSDLSKDWYDLGASLITALLKTLLTAALTAIVVSLIMVLLMVFGAATLPVIVVGGTVVSVGALLAYGVDAVDKSLGRAVSGDPKSDGVSAVVAPLLRAAGQRVEQNFIYLVKKFFTDYQEIAF